MERRPDLEISHCATLPLSCCSAPEGRVMLGWMVSPRFHPWASLPLWAPLCASLLVSFCRSLGLFPRSLMHLYIHVPYRNTFSFSKSRHWETKRTSPDHHPSSRVQPPPPPPANPVVFCIYILYPSKPQAVHLMFLYFWRELNHPIL